MFPRLKVLKVPVFRIFCKYKTLTKMSQHVKLFVAIPNKSNYSLRGKFGNHEKDHIIGSTSALNCRLRVTRLFDLQKEATKYKVHVMQSRGVCSVTSEVEVFKTRREEDVSEEQLLSIQTLLNQLTGIINASLQFMIENKLAIITDIIKAIHHILVSQIAKIDPKTSDGLKAAGKVAVKLIIPAMMYANTF